MKAGGSRLLLAFALAFGVGVAAYAFGVYSHAVSLWPVSQLRNLKRAATDQPLAVTKFDSFGRLLAFPGKVETSCPPQNSRTAVLVVFGGSNGGNYTGQRVASSTGGHSVNYSAGKCTLAVSPLLGADNTMGEYWTLVADGLIAAGLYDDVVIAVTTVGDSVSADWAPGGKLAPLIRATLADVGARYTPTLVLWDMGEDDFLRGVDPSLFSKNYQAIVADMRDAGVQAPVYLTIATKCMSDDYPWSAENPIAQAERKMPETISGLRLGVDRDALVKMLDRRDDCHLGSTGAAKMAHSWVERIRADR